MTGFAAVLLLAAGCWVVRVLFIALIPAERLPTRVSAMLNHLAPAVLAALISVETVAVAGAGDTRKAVAALVCVAGIALVAYVRPSVTVSAALGLAAIVLVDLLLP